MPYAAAEYRRFSSPGIMGAPLPALAAFAIALASGEPWPWRFHVGEAGAGVWQLVEKRLNLRAGFHLAGRLQSFNLRRR
jgi:hypothetical protein